MARKIASPAVVEASGRGRKRIEEFVGRVNSGTGGVSVARMRSEGGWSEPGQCPEFDEYTLVLGGRLRVETRAETIDIDPGEAVVVAAGEWVRYSSPEPGGADYVSVCLPAFSPDTVHRDEEEETKAFLPPEPRDGGVHEVSFAIGELTPYVDWTPFFHAKGLKGKYPGILDDRVEGQIAERYLDEARALLLRAEADDLLEIRAAYGFWPASSEGDDILVWEDEARGTVRTRVPCLRQERNDGSRGLCLADWIDPAGGPSPDWIGAFAVTAGIDLDERIAAMIARNDGNDATMLGLLAERLSHAAAEKLHEEVRKTYWGYAPEEDLPKFRLLLGAYRGLRASPGQASCPDRRGRRPILDLLGAPRRMGLDLDPSFDFVPAASACGWYFSHPGALPFAVGRIGKRAAAAYAARRHEDLAETERWLAAELDYKPGPDIISGKGA